MEREPVRQSQSDHGNTTNGDSNRTAPTASAASTPAPTPPRLTPNPTLLDSSAPHTAQQTPTASPPPPPLTPAPSLSSTTAPPASHVPKAVAAAAAVAAGAPPPPPPTPPTSHILVPAPPRLTSTGTPILRTYSRPILPSPMGGAPKTSSASAMLALSSSPSSLRLSAARSPSITSSHVPPSSSPSAPAVSSAPHPLPFSSSTTSSSSSVSPSVTHGDAAATAPPPPKSPAVLTNGNARPLSTHTSTAITPFHTPASPTGRQVTQALGTPGLVRANQVPTPVRQRVSQQALLLGKGLKGSGQDQALLRAQMLQSLTLRPPPPGTLAIPPSLRLKRPVSSSAPPPLSRGRSPLFPPLRPRPQPGAAVTESSLTSMPVRPHLSVPPPTLYSQVRAVPLRPRLHSPNGHGGAPPPRQSPTLNQPLATSMPSAHNTGQAPPSINRHLVALKACPLSQAQPNQSQQQQHAAAAMSMAAAASHQFERSPSAARQLQIIALSSGRQSQQQGINNNGMHAAAAAAHSSVQSTPLAAMENPDNPGSQLQRTLSGGGDAPHLLQQPLNPSMPKTSPVSSPPSLLCPSSPGGPPSVTAAASPQTHGLLVRQGEEQRDKGRGGGGQMGPRCGGGAVDEDIVGKDMRVNARDDQRGAEAKEQQQQQERKGLASNNVTDPIRVMDPREQQRAARAVPDQEERMEVTEEGERRERTAAGHEKEEGRENHLTAEQAENLSLHQNLHRHRNSEPPCSNNPEPNSRLTPAPVQNSVSEAKVLFTMPPGLVAATSSLPESPAQNQRLAEAQREPISHEDLCENMSTQSDNQSALSSLSSQSPPSSPFVTPSSDRAAPVLTPTSSSSTQPPAHHHHAANNNLSSLGTPLRQQPDKITRSQEEEAENRSEDEEEEEDSGSSSSGRWAPRAWPEGRQVLTHLVEGFVIQEGLQPFPVNRNSLLVEPGQSATPPPPAPQPLPQEVNGTNGTAAFAGETQQRSERLEHSTDTDEGEGGTADSSQKDRVVLHCQFCGKRGHAHNFMRSKRFCSTSCARGFNVRLTKRLRALSAGSSRTERPRPPLQRAESVPGKPLLLRLSRDSLQPRVLWTATRREAEEKGEREEEEEEEEEKDGEEADEEEDEPAVVVTTKAERRSAAKRTRRTASEPPMTTTTTTSAPTTPTTTYKSVPAHWSVEEVTAFIHTLPGCSEVAEAFRTQEIDGQALLLLTEDHLMTSMNIKLGPALKICAHINALRHQ